MKKFGLARRLIVEHVSIYYKNILWAILFMGIAAFSTAAFPYFLKPAFDYIFESKEKWDLIFFCGCILLSFIIKGMASYGESVIMQCVGQRIIFDIQERLFKHLLKSDLKFFHQMNSGELLSRFSNDVNMMRNAVSTTLVGIGKDLLTFLFLTFVMFYRDYTLAIFAFIAFPSAIIPISLIGRKVKKVIENTQNNLGIFSGYLTQIFQGIRIVKAYGGEEIETERIRSKMSNLMNLIVRSTKIKASLHPISEIIGGIAIILVIGYGGSQVIGNHKTTGDLISFLSALLLSYEPLKRLTHLSANMQEGLAAAKRVFEILDIEPSIKNSINPVIINNDIESIEFKNVSFGYNNNSNNIINNLSFKVYKGQTVAFVGKSGAGKSTIINLLPRFYDVVSGEILINSINIKDIDLENLREKISIVTQENILFDTSFLENISYGSSEKSIDDIKNAAKSAMADEFIVNSKDGYNSIVGENGIRISGGQRQRISIARAILKDAPILLLDEATSSLDTNSEKYVQKAIETLMHNKTTFVVAHRLSSIINADIIFVIENGTIVEKGNHKELLSYNGKYSKLWQSQNKL